MTVGYQSLLDAAPGVTVDGDVSSGLATAHVQSRPLADHGYCVDTFGDEPFTYARRYLEVDVFLTDRNGNATLLGTHRSWSGIEAQEDVP
jgi:hypothetical protein